MNVTIAEYVIKDVQEAGSYEFRLYNATAFTNNVGQLIPADEKSGRFAYRKVACVYDGVAKTITVPSIIIDSTTDSLDNEGARYAIAGIFRSGTLVRAILTDFPVPTDLGSPLSWTILKINQYAKRIFLDQGYYNKNQVNSLINEIVRLFGGEFVVPFTVELLTPIAGADISGTFFLTTLVTNYGSLTNVVEVEYFAGGVSIGLSNNAGSNFYVVGNSAGLADGVHQVFARMKDSDGDYYLSRPVVTLVGNVDYQLQDDFLDQISAMVPEDNDILKFMGGFLVHATRIALSNLPELEQGRFLGRAPSGSGNLSGLSMGDEFELSEAIFNIGENALALIKLQLIPTGTIIGRKANGTGSPEVISLNSDEIYPDPVSGLLGLVDNGVSFAKLPDLSPNSLIGRHTNSIGDPEEIILGTGLTITAGILNAEAGGLSEAEVYDLVASMFLEDEFDYNAGSQLLSLHNANLVERIQDAINALLAEGSNITLTYDDAGNVLTIAATGGGSSVGALGTVTTAVYTSGSIGDLISETGLITLAKSYEILRIEVSAPARVRFYTNSIARTADATRLIGVSPTGEHGLVADFLLESGNLIWDAAPIPVGTNLEAVRSTGIPIAVQNRSGSAAAITVTVTYLTKEI